MSGTLIMGAEDVRRGLVRIGHEIVERNRGHQDLVFVGMRTRGVPIAQRISAAIESFEGVNIPVGALDISLYRDDLRSRDKLVVQQTDIPVDIKSMRIILVDDVLFTGRSIRAALDALVDFGRPRSIELAVLVDRGHRELPIRADYVGKNVPTSVDKEEVQVRLKEVDGKDEVILMPRKGDRDDGSH